jgi:hypothetical protein
MCVVTTFKSTQEFMKQVAYQNTARMYAGLRGEIQAFLAITNSSSPYEIAMWLEAGHARGSLLTGIRTNTHGTPFLSSMIEQVEQRCHPGTLFVGYANRDIMFDHGVVDTMRLMTHWVTAEPRRVMIVGRRSNHDVAGPLSSGDVAGAKSVLFQENAQDYFWMSKSLINWAHLPPFVIGRNAYDNALVDWAFHHAILVDATATITALHQTTADGNFAGASPENADKEFNLQLPNIEYDHGTTSHAHFRTIRLSDGTVALSGPQSTVVVFKFDNTTLEG